MGKPRRKKKPQKVARPKLPKGWDWQHKKDGKGYLRSPCGQLTNQPVTPETAEFLVKIGFPGEPDILILSDIFSDIM